MIKNIGNGLIVNIFFIFISILFSFIIFSVLFYMPLYNNFNELNEKYIVLLSENIKYEELDEKYNKLLKENSENNITIMHLIDEINKTQNMLEIQEKLDTTEE